MLIFGVIGAKAPGFFSEVYWFLVLTGYSLKKPRGLYPPILIGVMLASDSLGEAAS